MGSLRRVQGCCVLVGVDTPTAELSKVSFAGPAICECPRHVPLLELSAAVFVSISQSVSQSRRVSEAVVSSFL
jgi:hypothetical protein